MNQDKRKHILLDDGLGGLKKSAPEESLVTYSVRNGDFSVSKNTSSFLYSRGRTSTRFFTEDSSRYITSRERFASESGYKLRRGVRFDGVARRFSRQRTRHDTSEMFRMGWWKIQRSFLGFGGFVTSIPDKITFRVSPVKMWNFSLVGAMIFGMVTMTMIYRYLGQSASADNASMRVASAPAAEELSVSSMLFEESDVEGVQDTGAKPPLPVESFVEQTAPVSFAADMRSRLSEEDKAFEETARKLVEGYPIESMLPFILEQDRKVAAYLIAIAKKESNWGKRVPVNEGNDCFNYWGYRGIRKKMGTGGHTCFDNRKDAVETVGKRLSTLVVEKKLDTPEKLIVWKCGSSCAGHDSYGVRKWISDVDMYMDKLKKKG